MVIFARPLPARNRLSKHKAHVPGASPNLRSPTSLLRPPRCPTKPAGGGLDTRTSRPGALLRRPGPQGASGTVPQPYLAQQQPHPAPVTYAAAGANPALSAENIASRAAHSRDPFEALSENSQMSDALDRIANEYRRLAGAKVREGIGFRTIPQAENYVRVTRRDLPVFTEPSLARETLTLVGLAQQGE